MSSVCVAIFTAYLLLSCCLVAVNASGATAAALHGGVQDAETSQRVYEVRVRAQDICVDVDQSMISMKEVVQGEVGC